MSVGPKGRSVHWMRGRKGKDVTRWRRGVREDGRRDGGRSDIGGGCRSDIGGRGC